MKLLYHDFRIYSWFSISGTWLWYYYSLIEFYFTISYAIIIFRFQNIRFSITGILNIMKLLYSYLMFSVFHLMSSVMNLIDSDLRVLNKGLQCTHRFFARFLWAKERLTHLVVLKEWQILFKCSWSWNSVLFNFYFVLHYMYSYLYVHVNVVVF